MTARALSGVLLAFLALAQLSACCRPCRPSGDRQCSAIGPGLNAPCVQCPPLVDLQVLTEEEVLSSSPRDLSSREAACLACPSGPERRLVAAYLIDTGRVWPPGLRERMMRSSDPDDRRLALLNCAVTCDADQFWQAIARERDPVVAENGLDALLYYAAYDGDRRMLVQLRRVIGVRTGRPMKAVDILQRLIPDADVHVLFGRHELLVETWKSWLDEHAAVLEWDASAGRFELGSRRRWD